MEINNFRIIIDLDNTICNSKNGYKNAIPNLDVIRKICEYKNKGYDIVIHSSRNMRTYENNIGKINANTLPDMIEWLNKNNVPYDEIIVGKPWCGKNGFYVDDRAIRPDEFVNLNENEIRKLLKGENNDINN